MTRPAWDFGYMKTLTCRPLSQGRVFTSARGTGPILLLIHGGFHGAWCWADWMHVFEANGIPCAAVDTRGHGGLPQSPDFVKQGVRAMAADVTEAARALGADVVLAGHSLGALVAMVAAEQIGPKGLVLLAPSPPNNIPNMKALPAFPETAVIAPPSEERTRKWFLPGFSGADIAPFLTRLSSESPTFLNDRYQLRAGADPAWVKGPALCVSAALDDNDLHPAGQDEAIAKYYGAEFQVLPKAGHCFMADDSWELGADAILGWLRRNHLAGSALV
jgi:pimeloyl-ACP methyl ester carboxylesterase